MCEMLQQLNRIIAVELLSGRDLWRDVMFSVFHLSPILNSLLSVPRASVHDDVLFRERECYRLACILYVANLRAKFDPEPGVGMLYGSKLKLIIDQQDMVPLWNRSSNSYLLWTLTVAACASSCLFDDLRNHFVARLSESLQVAGIVSFDGLVSTLDGITWCEEAYRTELGVLRDQINLSQ